ncbi:acyl-CoA N-acyltransferase [Pseudomassariella vexata]|uniref:Acyl-CoA N-acyltransferase n=1 Tax=Pseudomassariella vexata TaxID=1141098 RepID=A0A1Y2EKU3_9PEZI|nr:acyl-CoA N-acyltransferase [Pseudomassariella vexata]ORY72128.1 acyl-CoA N-acyltransferase [Pseudomassariella vexata]
MGLTMRPATSADTPAMCAVFFDAFQNHGTNTRIFPASSPHAQSFIFNTLSAEISNPRAYFHVITDSSSPTPEKIIAFAKWNGPDPKPGSDSNYQKPAQLPFPEDGDTELAKEFFETIAQKQEEHMGMRRHWCLGLIGVKTEVQGRGAGGMLVKWGLDRADADGLEAYLVASPSGAPIYRRYGFEDIEVWTLKGHTECFMLRKAKAGKLCP